VDVSGDMGTPALGSVAPGGRTATMRDAHNMELDPPGGPAVLTDYAEAWGIEEPPWVFVINRDGQVHAKFTGVIGSDELRAAITSITPWHPVA
jgi:hypothetical protein